MAKRKSVKSRQHNTDELVLVKSRTYGEHYRATRGSKKVALLNEVLTAHAAKTAVLNASAKAVYDILRLYTEGFKEGQLWQAILSRMRKAKDTSFENLLDTLKGLEMNSRYPIKRFGDVPFFIVVNSKKTMNMQMKLSMPPQLFKNDNCYAYTLIVLMFSGKGICIGHIAENTEWIYKNEKPGGLRFCFDKPARTKNYLLCLEFNGGVNGVATGTLASRGMIIVPGYNEKRD